MSDRVEKTLLQMKVAGLTVDPLTNSPIVILKDEGADNALPIWIGVPEASAIAAELEKLKFARPMTHDLARDMLAAASAVVTRVEVNDLRDNVYYATIHIEPASGGVRLVDARPSDAIAIALRTGASIYVASEVVKKAMTMDIGGRSFKGDGPGKWLELLEGLSPEAFGKYKM